VTSKLPNVIGLAAICIVLSSLGQQRQILELVAGLDPGHNVNCGDYVTQTEYAVPDDPLVRPPAIGLSVVRGGGRGLPRKHHGRHVETKRGQEVEKEGGTDDVARGFRCDPAQLTRQAEDLAGGRAAGRKDVAKFATNDSCHGDCCSL